MFSCLHRLLAIRALGLGGPALAALLGSGPAVACEAPASPQVFAIEHEVFGRIGRHVISFRCDGRALHVDTDVEIAVRILRVTAYRREARYHEVWDDGTLIRFDGRVADPDGERTVSARRDGRRVVIDGDSGRTEAPADVVPNHPWKPALLARMLAFDVNTGELIRQRTQSAGKETVDVGAGRVTAKKFVTSGDRERELWYDDQGLVRWRLQYAGAAITLSRQDDG